MSSPSRRLQSINYHLNPPQDGVSHFESLRIQRTPDQLPYHSTLDPLRFLLRSAMVYSNKTAVIHREKRYTYQELADRVKALANVLIDKYNIKKGDRVGVLCQNITPFLDAQYAVPAVGAILVPINTRLAAKEVEYIIDHSGASLVLVQEEFANKITEKILSSKTQFIKVADTDDTSKDPYEQLLLQSDNRLAWKDLPTTRDEFDVISLNYTSGSTGRPKGVMVTHRGAYLASLAMLIQSGMTPDSVYLWTLPMFHCNGWGFPWAVVAIGGTQVMLNKLDYGQIWDLLKRHGVTHYNGAPTVQNEICNHEDASPLNHPVRVFSGGSALSSTLIRRMKDLNLQPTQVYGLTETYGPAALSYDASTLSGYSESAQHKLLARQGFNTVISDEVRVINSQTGLDVTPNGAEVGEICISGNQVMKGYYNNSAETAKAFKNGMFWTGDLAVRHHDGSVEIVDRSKDVIVSGGENISSIEVESAIVELEEVSECSFFSAIVGGPDPKWGERPYAFVILKRSKSITAETIINHCRNSLAGYKCPSKIIVVDSLPKTSTGKVQKFKLREQLWNGLEKRVN
ncbi:hypothetical protein BDB01DRAFT_830650 [Pilobolus umbonatus]|nr:hypothetical protein BDB01DRAFT_830650 [Pilobolus umbonatus]